MKDTLKKIVFPAAGMGTRFLPATKATPKEMLTVVDKPMIQYGVEEALASGMDDIIMVTGRGKHAIEDHFDISAELEANLNRAGKSESFTRSTYGIHGIYSSERSQRIGSCSAMRCQLGG